MDFQFKFSGAYEIKLSPDNQYFITLSRSSVLWNAENGKKKAVLRRIKNPAHCNFSPCGRWLAVKGVSGKIAFYDLHALKHKRTIRPTKNEGCGVYFSPDGRYAVSAGWDGTIYTVRLSTGAVRVIKKMNESVLWIDYRERSGEFVFYGERKYIRWKYPFEKNTAAEQKYTRLYERILAWSETHRCCAVEELAGIVFMNEDCTEVIKKYTIVNRKGKAAPVKDIAWSPDGKRIALIIADETEDIVRLLEYETLHTKMEFGMRHACHVEFTKDGRLLIGAYKESWCIEL